MDSSVVLQYVFAMYARLSHLLSATTALTTVATTANAQSLSSASGVYDTSTTPAHLPWNTYNYCNAPHVNAEHYEFPANVSNATLVYANMMMRHHKVCAHVSSI